MSMIDWSTADLERQAQKWVQQLRAAAIAALKNPITMEIQGAAATNSGQTPIHLAIKATSIELALLHEGQSLVTQWHDCSPASRLLDPTRETILLLQRLSALTDRTDVQNVDVYPGGEPRIHLVNGPTWLNKIGEVGISILHPSETPENIRLCHRGPGQDAAVIRRCHQPGSTIENTASEVLSGDDQTTDIILTQDDAGRTIGTIRPYSPIIQTKPIASYPTLDILRAYKGLSDHGLDQQHA